MTCQEIHQVLIDEFGPYCWGCNFKALTLVILNWITSTQKMEKMTMDSTI